MSEEAIEKFKRYVENLVEDKYLDEGEERDAMIHAAQLGLQSNEATELLKEVCIEKGAKLESIEKKEFIDEILSDIDDGFLDCEEEEKLLQAGIERFEDSDDPEGIAKKILSMVLGKNRCLTENQFREYIEKKLKPYINSGAPILPKDWDILKESSLKYAENKGVDLEENDLDEVLDTILEENGIKIGTPKKEKSNSMLLIVLLAFAIIGGGVYSLTGKPVDRPPTITKTTTKTKTKTGSSPLPDLPSCSPFADELKMASNKWHKAAESTSYCTSEGNNSTVFTEGRKVRRFCKDFEELSNPAQKRAIEQYRCWEYCDLDRAEISTIGDFYTQASNRASGTMKCEWIRRCLAVIPGHEGCGKVRSSLGCSFTKSDFERCD